MKRFFAWVLIIIIFFIGIFCFTFAMTTDGWVTILLMIGTTVITVPAMNWWKDYFYNLFDIEN